MDEKESVEAQMRELERQRDEAVFNAQNWGQKYRSVLEEVQRIKPLYRRFYRNPFFWFIRPMDEEIDGRIIMRCWGESFKMACTCGKLFWTKSDSTPGIHKFHQHRRATQMRWREYLVARYLPFLIRTKKPGDPFLDN